MTFEIWIPGAPIAWARAGRRMLPDGRVITFDQKAQRSWKSTFVALTRFQMMKRGERAPLFPHPMPVRLVVVCCASLAVTKFRKREPVPESWDIGRKDWDNLGKLVGDAGNELLWTDDRQIVSGGPVVKVCMAQGEPAGVYVLAEAVPELRLDEASVYLDRARRVAGLVPMTERRTG